VPVGVPAVEAIVAVKITGFNTKADVADVASAIVGVAWFTVRFTVDVATA
jgi:hypothetical protein